MFSEHLSSLPVDGFLKSRQQGIQWQLNMLPMDLSGWVSLPPPYCHWLSPLRPRGLAALPGETPIPSPLPRCISRYVLTCLSLSHLLVAPKRPDKWIMKDMWLGGEVAVLCLFKPPLGVTQGLCKETCFPQVLMSMGQVALTLCKVWLSLLVV